MSTGASFTYRFVAGGRTLYLRLTPPGWQDVAALRGECTYIDWLHSATIGVARPVPSGRGELIEPVLDGGRTFLAMAFEAAPEFLYGTGTSNGPAALAGCSRRCTTLRRRPYRRGRLVAVSVRSWS